MMSALPAFAHHGWGGNEDKLSDVTGTVTTASASRARTRR
jgi:hypothetical protein